MRTSSGAAEAQQPTAAAAAPAGGGGAGTAQGSQLAGSTYEQVAISMPTSAAAAAAGGPQQQPSQRSGPLGWLRRNRSTGAAEALPTASSDSALRRWHTGPPHLVTLQGVPSGGSSSGAGLPSAYSAVYAVHQPGSNRWVAVAAGSHAGRVGPPVFVHTPICTIPCCNVKQCSHPAAPPPHAFQPLSRHRPPLGTLHYRHACFGAPAATNACCLSPLALHLCACSCTRWPCRSAQECGHLPRPAPAASTSTPDTPAPVCCVAAAGAAAVAYRGGQDSQPWPHANNLQQIYIMQMSQLAESANAAAMLSTHSGLRFAEPPPGPSNWAGTGGGSSSSRPPAHNSSSGQQ
jgi:hypothetical protein